ncbi:MAG: bifunctional demethylmenaquinone methyltransferase/2-methoxy-6-polyprenyl-1,4-benzoquinol methylase UbiE [Oscillatoria sp. PMC 1068.18]|nr:bifunctional demethylmenaquinone methyltransferase/2-methoxy-6-polyprenyl-1,4-benzoquinol methylase UbiE [Oscillatoria sp. PMC 1076.18]MEC4990403.1 bifunctional demethylmenaquinone methyltransferase/2-methoxy-6-polyprenyl-1,4-benzoquinol methylase UbiE [Oscillatoria sp. PMC 1068.18]
MKDEQIKQLFNRIAPEYDRLNHTLSLGLHRVWKQMAVKWTEVKPGDVGLDVCCGSGDLALLLAKQVGTTGKVIGVDFAEDLLEIARQRSLVQSPLLNLNWIAADALNLPFDDNTFDCATMGYGLRNVTDIPRCLSELHRVLKSGAKAAILDFHRPSQPIFQQFQQWYLDQIVVPSAEKLGLKDDYAYIFPSLERFPVGREQVKLAHQAGFTQATHYELAAGMMGILVLKKA